MTLKEIKKDLRRIQHFERVLKSKRIIENQCRERIDYLRKQGHSTEALAEREQVIFELEATIKQLNIPDFIRRGTVLKNRYIQYINMLDEQDQELINLCFVNFCPSRKAVADDLGYSKDWLEKHLCEACKRLCEIINGEGA